MAAFIDDTVFDAALNLIKTTGDKLHILSSGVTALANVAAASLGNKALTSGNYTGPEDHTTGRKITEAAITDGSVTGTGTASHFCIIDEGTKLLITQELNASQGVTSGNIFTLTAVIIAIPDPTA